jgi:nucleotide-binding universal stress UspA family protein
MKRILVPTDFSMEAENAIQTAIPIARAFEATIVLLHVLEVSSSESFNELKDMDNEKTVSESVHINESLKQAQENFSRSYALHGLDDVDIKLEQYIRVGSPINQIEECIEKENIDFVIMGTKEAWGLNDILLGTTTDKLLRKVNCPVLSVNEVAPATAFNNIVFPSTTYSKETGLIETIKKFQQAFEAKIHLVRINTPLHFMSDKDSLALLEEYAEDNNLNNYEAHVYAHTEEEDGIREFAEYIKGGMIAVSTSAHTGLWKIIQGSVTKELVNHSKRPVLTVKMDQD